MVFSFGGGTHDVTTMEIEGETYKVLATSGDTETGGADIDNAIVQRLANQFYNETGVNLRESLPAMVRLKEAAEKAKIELSSELTVEVGVPFLADVGGAQKHLKYELTQAELEEIALPIVRRVDKTIRTVLIDSRLAPEDIDKLILIGGQTKMPLVRRVVEEYMGKAAEEGVDPMQCVAIGAAYQGAVLAGKLNYKLLDVTPLTLGIEDAAGTVQKIIYRNTPIPISKSQSFTTREDNQTEVSIHVVQGERTMAADCVSIGRFDLEGFAPKPRGATQIVVGFEIDANGILKVSAKELSSGVEQKVNITGRMKISEEERSALSRRASPSRASTAREGRMPSSRATETSSSTRRGDSGGAAPSPRQGSPAQQGLRRAEGNHGAPAGLLSGEQEAGQPQGKDGRAGRPDQRLHRRLRSTS